MNIPHTSQFLKLIFTWRPTAVTAFKTNILLNVEEAVTIRNLTLK
jgi:hypothetical protein